MGRITAQQVVIEIIRLADGELSGKTRLFKAFYFAHLAYYDKNPGILTDWPIARMPNGPGIDKCESLLGTLINEGLLEIELYHDGFYPEYRYRLTEKAKAINPLPPRETTAISRAVEFVVSKSCSELSHITHEHSRSWQAGKDGDILDIYIDLIPEEDYERLRRRMTEASPFDAIFAS